MSEPRIALVSEGETDRIVVEAALRAILPTPFTLEQLQPEATQPKMGTGWGGVLKWCDGFRTELAGGPYSLSTHPTLAGFDLVIIHVDADVADKAYDHISPTTAMQAAARGWTPLPCSTPCPPPGPTVSALQACVCSWLGVTNLGPKALFCIPSKAIEAWLAAGLYPNDAQLLTGLECTFSMEARLKSLPKAKKVTKSKREYRNRAAAMTHAWPQVCALCSQAYVFDQDVKAALAL